MADDIAIVVGVYTTYLLVLQDKTVWGIVYSDGLRSQVHPDSEPPVNYGTLDYRPYPTLVLSFRSTNPCIPYDDPPSDPVDWTACVWRRGSSPGNSISSADVRILSPHWSPVHLKLSKGRTKADERSVSIRQMLYSKSSPRGYCCVYPRKSIGHWRCFCWRWLCLLVAYMRVVYCLMKSVLLICVQCE